jgi:ribosomal protein S18 acetylase RimI-like enzyme
MGTDRGLETGATTAAVRALRPQDVAETADLLARALDYDPAYRFLFPSDRARPTGLRDFFRRNLQVHLPFGCTFVSTSGAAVCATITVRPPEGFRIGALTMIRHGLLPFAAAHGARAVGRLLALKRVYDELEAAAASGRPHWHVHMMAVDPACQGQGLGSHLLRSVLARETTSDSRPVVLTTHKPINVTFYRRFGFDVTSENDVQLGVPYRVFSMRRAQPATG